MLHTAFTPTIVRTAGLFDAGENLMGDFTKFCMYAAAAGVAWFLLKEMFKIKTVLAGVIAIAAAVGLFWGIGQTQNKDIQNTFTDTLQQSTGGGAANTPAKKG